MAGVCLLWENSRLLGVYASEDVAEQEADRRRADIASRRGRHGVEVRVEIRRIEYDPAPGADERKGLRAQVARAVERWPLADEDQMLLAVQEPVWDRYLMVPFRGRLWLPEFQFERRGVPWTGLREVLQVLRQAGWNESRIYVWLTRKQKSMGGRIPAECLADDAEGVLAAARAYVKP